MTIASPLVLTGNGSTHQLIWPFILYTITIANQQIVFFSLLSNENNVNKSILTLILVTGSFPFDFIIVGRTVQLFSLPLPLGPKMPKFYECWIHFVLVHKNQNTRVGNRSCNFQNPGDGHSWNISSNVLNSLLYNFISARNAAASAIDARAVWPVNDNGSGLLALGISPVVYHIYARARATSCVWCQLYLSTSITAGLTERSVY